MKMRRAVVILASAASPLLALGAFLAFLQFSGNFHEVVAGELYRSAQPTTAQIETYVKDHGIRTIVNLRGASKGSDWYRQEIQTASALGLTHVDFKMSADQELTTAQTDKLIHILRDVPKPVLIHCQAGADRSGLVAAIYLHALRGVDVETAEQQISIRYGHIGIPYVSSAFAMDESWEKLETAFKASL